MPRRTVFIVVGGIVLMAGGWVLGSSPMIKGLFGWGNQQPKISSSSLPIDAATLAGHDGLYCLDAGHLTGTLSTDRFSAYQDLEDEGKIGQGSTIITDQNLPPISISSGGTITGVKTGLGLVGGGTSGSVTVALNPGVGLAFSKGKLVAVLGDSIDLASDETVSVLPVAKGGTGLSDPPTANEVLVGTGTGYTYGLLSDGDGTKLINASGQLSYSVDSTVCRTSGNCAGAGGGITGSGTPNHLARFTSTGSLSDSLLYDTGSALGIGTTTPQALLDIQAPDSTLGSELVSNGSFNGNAAGWNLYDCGSYANGQATVNYTYACSSDQVSTTFTTTVGHTYQVTFTLVSATNDQVNWYLGNSSGSTQPFNPGTYTGTFVGGITGTETIYFEGWNWNNGSSWTIDNVSVKEIQQPTALSVAGRMGINTAIAANALDVNGGVAVGSFAGTAQAPANGLAVSGNVAIGKSTASTGTLDVLGGNSDPNGYAAGIASTLNVMPTANGTSYNRGLTAVSFVPNTNAFSINAVHGLDAQALNSGTGSISALNGMNIYGSNYGNAPISYLRGAYLVGQNYSGVVGDLRALDVVSNMSGGSATNQYGLFLNGITISGGAAVANRYGLYIGSMAGATTSANDFALYSSPTQKSYLAGSLGLGTTTPQSKLDINGGLAVGTYAGANAAPSNGLIVSGNVGIGTNNPGAALDVTSLATTANGAQITANSITSGKALSISATGLTTGQALSVTGTSTSTANEPALASLTYTANPAASSTAGYDGIFVKSQTATGSNGNLITNNLTGMAGYAQNNSTSGSIFVARGLLGQVMSAATGGTISNAYALQAGAPYISAGAITNSYGLYVSNQTGGTNNYGIYIAGATTASLWLGSDGANAASGITFGSTKDTDLYRLAAASLKTDGLFTAGSGIVIGSGGTQIKKHISTTVTWDPPSMATGAATSTTVTITGAAVGDVVTVGFSQALPDGVLISGSVSAANTIKVTIGNLSGASVDLTSGTLRVADSQY